MQTGKTVSLVLGGGGARGLAHIGVIEWLTENGFEIRSIAGSSMGALVGGIYAAGKLDAYRHWVTALDKGDVLRLLDPNLGFSGLFKGARIIDTLRELLGERDIEDLPISFTAVATDVEEQKEVWLSRGPLFDAIRASIAVPLVFTPHRVNGRRLLDGSLVNPLPIAPTLRDATDLTIAVNLSGPPENATPAPAAAAAEPATGAGDSYRARIQAFIDELQERFLPEEGEPDWSYFDIITLSMETMQNTITRLKLAAYTPDVIVTIPRDSARLFEFYRARELIALGREKAAEGLGSSSGRKRRRHE
ncbi:MAG: patatin-like phospholipase family protein [Gammaproteobacteria bacterium]|nr:patatin-like phospholipase family protein [Gammaproteobacteria bacterium]